MVIDGVRKVGMIPRCLLHPNQNVCPTHTDSPDFDRSRACGGYSVIAKLGSLHLFGAQKNDVRDLRDGALGVVRPRGSSGPRSVQRGHAHPCGAFGILAMA